MFGASSLVKSGGTMYPLFLGAAALLLAGLALWYFTRRPAPSAPKTAPAPVPTMSKPVLRDFKEADLVGHDGRVAGKDILIAAYGYVFNMSSHPSGPSFYGPGSGYNVFAGRDASVGLALMELDPSKWTPMKADDFSPSQRDTLVAWVEKFHQKYQLVGFLNDGAYPMTVEEAKRKGLVHE